MCADVLPTEFFCVPFPLKDDVDCDESLEIFDKIADDNVDSIITYPEYSVLKLDPYVVHRCAVSKKTQNRTFVKISISKKIFGRVGNTKNTGFDYSWPLGERNKDTRNHPWNCVPIKKQTSM